MSKESRSDERNTYESGRGFCQEKVRVGDFTHYDDKELMSLVRALEEEILGDVLLMCLYTSMEISETLAVTTDSIDFERKTITVRLINMEKYEHTAVKLRRWDKIYPLTEDASAIIKKRIEQHSLKADDDTYRANNPYSFIFVDKDGKTPEMSEIEALRYSVPKKSGVRDVTSRRLIRHFKYVHQSDFYPAV